MEGASLCLCEAGFVLKFEDVETLIKGDKYMVESADVRRVIGASALDTHAARRADQTSVAHGGDRHLSILRSIDHSKC